MPTTIISVLKKIIPAIILIGLILIGMRLFSGSEDQWIKNSQGQWIRSGNPALPIPQNVMRDCFEQNGNRSFDVAYILCREDLCSQDRECARFLEKQFQTLKELSDALPTNQPPAQITPEPTNTNAPVTNTPTPTSPEPVTQPTNTNTETQTTPTPELPPSSEGATPIPTPTPGRDTSTGAPEQPKGQLTINPNITIETPTLNSSVTSPIVITGKVKAAAGEPIDVQITTPSGTVLIGETAKLKSSGPDGWATYKITIAYQFSSTRQGYVVVSHNEDKASVPVTFN